MLGRLVWMGVLAATSGLLVGACADDGPASPPELEASYGLVSVQDQQLPARFVAEATELTILADTIEFFVDGGWARRRAGRLLITPSQTVQDIDSETHGTLMPLDGGLVVLDFVCDDQVLQSGSCIPPDTARVLGDRLEIARSGEWSLLEDLVFQR